MRDMSVASEALKGEVGDEDGIVVEGVGWWDGFEVFGGVVVGAKIGRVIGMADPTTDLKSYAAISCHLCFAYSAVRRSVYGVCGVCVISHHFYSLPVSDQ